VEHLYVKFGLFGNTIAASVFEISCGKQTEKTPVKTLPPRPPLAWVTKVVAVVCKLQFSDSRDAVAVINTVYCLNVQPADSTVSYTDCMYTD